MRISRESMNMNGSDKDKKTGWWRYPVAALIFIAMFFLLPALIAFARWLLDLLSVYRRESVEERMLAGYVIAPFFTNMLAESVLQKKNVFLIILCCLAGTYSIFVATWNYAAGANTLLGSALVGGSGLIYLGIAVWDGVQIGKESKESAT